MADAQSTSANGGYEAITYANDNGSGYNATLAYQANNAAGGDYSRGTLTVVGDKVSLGAFGSFDDTVTTDIAAATVDAAPTIELAKGGLAQLDSALSKIDGLRSSLGAVQNRFEDAITNETNLAAARSRIEDADYAVEVANMTRAQILQQAGTSVLAQANQIPQNVLSLLG